MRLEAAKRKRAAKPAISSCFAVVTMWGVGVAAGTVYWDFNTLGPTANAAEGVAVGVVGRVNGGTTELLSGLSSSGGYTGASGLTNIQAAAQGGGLSTNGSTWLEWTCQPVAGMVVSVTNLAFGVRSTASGPTAYCLRSDADGFKSDWSVGALTADSVWARKQHALAFRSAKAGAAVTFRLYGYGGTGANPGNWRVDDLSLAVGSVNPEEATPPVIVPIPPQGVRLGETLVFELAVMPTDGDPVTVTNVTASEGVAGVWALEAGRFRYSPAPVDLGKRLFTFSAQDKDGVSLAMTVEVTVRCARLCAVLMEGASGVYTQDFSGLSCVAGDAEWDDAAEPLGAWYAVSGTSGISSYRVGTGSGTTGGLYAFGEADGAERSLGSLASDGNTYRYGVAFSNATERAVTNLAIRYAAEQWRVASGITNTLVCEYCVTNRVVPLNEGEWRYAGPLCFETPLVTNAVLPVGQVYIAEERSAEISRPIMPGQVVMVRWSDADDVGIDHAFGIDDLSVAWAAGDVPDAVPVGAGGVQEMFDDMPRDGGGQLPFGWRIEGRDDAVRVTGAYDSAGDGTGHVNSGPLFTDAGTYTFLSGVTGDPCVGALPGTAGDPTKSVSLFVKLQNRVGMPVRRWKVVYEAEKYRRGTVGCCVSLLASSSGGSWALVGGPVVFESDADAAGYASELCPGEVVTVEEAVRFNQPVEDGAFFYLAWQISVADGESVEGAQAVGVDSVQIFPEYRSQCVIFLK